MRGDSAINVSDIWNGADRIKKRSNDSDVQAMAELIYKLGKVCQQQAEQLEELKREIATR